MLFIACLTIITSSIDSKKVRGNMAYSDYKGYAFKGELCYKIVEKGGITCKNIL
jgi:hypothetical protein